MPCLTCAKAAMRDTADQERDKLLRRMAALGAINCTLSPFRATFFALDATCTRYVEADPDTVAKRQAWAAKNQATRKDPRMTCIAWDGTTLASDKRASSSGFPITVTKIFRTAYGLVGLAGSGPVARALLAWVNDGMDPAKWPACAEESDAEIMVITPDGKCTSYGARPYPLVIEDGYAAVGCGRDFALAAMYLGKSAEEAVEVACALDIHCGNGIDALTLQEPQP
jgi:hypothetical protein